MKLFQKIKNFFKKSVRESKKFIQQSLEFRGFAFEHFDPAHLQGDFKPIPKMTDRLESSRTGRMWVREKAGFYFEDKPVYICNPDNKKTSEMELDQSKIKENLKEGYIEIVENFGDEYSEVDKKLVKDNSNTPKELSAWIHSERTKFYVKDLEVGREYWFWVAIACVAISLCTVFFYIIAFGDPFG